VHDNPTNGAIGDPLIDAEAVAPVLHGKTGFRRERRTHGKCGIEDRPTGSVYDKHVGYMRRCRGPWRRRCRTAAKSVEPGNPEWRYKWLDGLVIVGWIVVGEPRVGKEIPDVGRRRDERVVNAALWLDDSDPLSTVRVELPGRTTKRVP